MATPMRAHWAAAWSSALRMSGRRRSRSAGMPTATSSGASGMAERSPSRRSRLRGRHAEQGAERVLGLPEAGLDLGNGGLGAPQLGERLLHVALAGGPALETGLGDPQAFFLNDHVVPGDPQALLEGADEHVGARHVGREAHQGIVVGGDGPEEVRILGLDGAPELAPEIDFPAGGGRPPGPACNRSRRRPTAAALTAPRSLSRL